ncbi:Uncharacterised protein [Mycobacteroides abscessus subsp. abscessus]|nr:Uncharacterised protein [Mycobacteroides abscessus subsp. abscessus]
MSSSRPSMNNRPSASKCPTSPLESSPSTISLFRPSVYPLKLSPLETKIVPTTPGSVIRLRCSS